MSGPEWHLPDLTGRTYLVTGSNAGLGYFSCEHLVRAGADVIMSARNPARLAAARAALFRRVPEAAGHDAVESLVIDTSNSGSLRAAAATLRSRGALDGVLLNAGIVPPPKRRTLTRDGNELVFATNVLGHFALAGELLPALAAAGGRMVWVGSMSTSMWRYDPVDPQLSEGYTPWRAYVQIATSSLGFEADRRLRGADVAVASVVAHPGYSTSGRTAGIRGVNNPSRLTRFADNIQAPVTQSKEVGAQPLVHALAASDVAGGEYWGPRARLRGEPRRGTSSRVTQDREVAARIWEVCEHATGVAWPFAKAAKTKRLRR